MGERSAGNPHAAFDVEGAGNVARHRAKPARQSSTLPMSGVWKRSQGRTSEAPPDERGGNRYVRPTATAPHSDSTDSMMVLRARRGGTGSKYVTLRGGLRRAIPFLLVRSGCGADKTVRLR